MNRNTYARNPPGSGPPPGLAGRTAPPPMLARPTSVLFVACALALAAPRPASAADLAPPEFRTGKGHRASIEQTGLFNQADVDQRGRGHFAEVQQDGVHNRLQALQIRNDNFLIARQSGGANVASVTQSGTFNRLELQQHGVANLANVEQFGYGRTALIEQVGNGNRVDIVQNAPNVVVRQYGDHLVATLIQH